MEKSTLELVADALEMVLCGSTVEGIGILTGIRDKLKTTAESSLRLSYQWGGISSAILLWVIYLLLHHNPCCMPTGWEPWLLAAALGAAGGAFSVCLTVNSLEINLNQKGLFLFFAGFSRVLVALLSGIVLLLAMRAKMIASSVYSSGPPEISAALTAVELFFTFLAGFSETFVPNILRDSEKSAGTAGINRTTEQIVAAEKAKAEAEQKAKAEAEQKAKAGAEQKAKAEAEQKDKAGAEQKAKAEAEQKAKAEAEQKAKAEAEQKDKAGK